jgi:hypothetical protein
MLKIPSDIKFYTGSDVGYHVRVVKALKSEGKDLYELGSVLRFTELPDGTAHTQLLTQYNGTGLHKDWCLGISKSDKSKVKYYYVANGGDHSFESRNLHDFNIIRTAQPVTDIFEFTNSQGRKVITEPRKVRGNVMATQAPVRTAPTRREAAKAAARRAAARRPPIHRAAARRPPVHRAAPIGWGSSRRPPVHRAVAYAPGYYMSPSSQEYRDSLSKENFVRPHNPYR